MKIPFGKPIVGKREFAAVLNVLKSGKYVHGPKSVEFEKNFELNSSLYKWTRSRISHNFYGEKVVFF